MCVLWFIGLAVIVIGLMPIVALIGAVIYGVNAAQQAAQKKKTTITGDESAPLE